MTGPAAIPPDLDMLVAEYVLGVLPHAERLALAARLAEDPELAARARFWEEQLAPLGAALEPVQPPPRLLAALENRLFPAAAPPPGLWRSLAFWRGLAAALGVVLVVLGLSLGGLWRATAPAPPSLVADVSGAPGSIRLVAAYDAASGVLKLNLVAGEPAPGRDFQLWLIDGAAAPVSLGVLPRRARAAVAIPAALAGKLSERSVLAVSDEPEGGSPTGLPTGPVLATGALAAI